MAQDPDRRRRAAVHQPHPGAAADRRRLSYETANSGFEAGIQAESFHPDTIVIDLAMGRSEGLQIAPNLRRNAQYETTLIIALASEDESDPDALTQYGYSEAFKKPFDAALLAERIRTLVDERARKQHVRSTEAGRRLAATRSRALARASAPRRG